MKNKKQIIEELLEFEEDFRNKLMKTEGLDPLMQIGRMMLINQSVLFSMKLERLKSEGSSK